MASSRLEPDHFPIDPPPRTSILTGLLAFLNIVAAGLFLFILHLDLDKRRAWTRASFVTDVHIHGMPLAQEDVKPTGVLESDPKPMLRSEDLKAAFSERRPNATVRESFVAQKMVPQPPIGPGNFDDERLKAMFGDQPAVSSLEDEVKRVQKTILADIEKTAQDAVQAEPNAADRRRRLESVLLSQAADSYEIVELNKLIAATPDDKLGDLLGAAYQRRMILDILRPVEFHRWGDPNRPYLHFTSTSDISGLNLPELRKKLVGRLENSLADTYDSEFYRGKEWGSDPTNKGQKRNREAFEKRDNIASLLFTIAHVRKPDGKLLYEQELERTQIVLGLSAFAVAAENFNQAMTRFKDRLVEQIRDDREGRIVTMDYAELKKYIEKRTAENADEDTLKKLQAELKQIPEKGTLVFRTPGFTELYEALIIQLHQQVVEIERARINLQAKQIQKTKAEKVYLAGKAEVEALQKELLVERARTARLLLELQGVQDRLFRSQRDLASAAEENEILNRRIRQAEEDQGRFEGLLPPRKDKAP